MNQKQRKEKLKRAQHHQRQSVEMRKEITKDPHVYWIDQIKEARERQSERQAKSASQERIHINVPRRHSSLSYWFQRLAVKIALASKSAIRFFSLKTRH